MFRIFFISLYRVASLCHVRRVTSLLGPFCSKRVWRASLRCKHTWTRKSCTSLSAVAACYMWIFIAHGQKRGVCFYGVDCCWQWKVLINWNQTLASMQCRADLMQSLLFFFRFTYYADALDFCRVSVRRSEVMSFCNSANWKLKVIRTCHSFGIEKLLLFLDRLPVSWSTERTNGEAKVSWCWWVRTFSSLRIFFAAVALLTVQFSCMLITGCCCEIICKNCCGRVTEGNNT